MTDYAKVALDGCYSEGGGVFRVTGAERRMWLRLGAAVRMARCRVRRRHGLRVAVKPFGGAHVCGDCGLRVWASYAPFRPRSRAAHDLLKRRLGHG